MSALVVDTSSWISFFKGVSLPEIDDALKDGRVYLCPVVAAELLSGKITPGKRQALVDFLNDLPLIPCELEHWLRVGDLRRKAADKGLNISTPDAHIAQCAIDVKGRLHSKDAIFRKLASLHFSALVCSE